MKKATPPEEERSPSHGHDTSTAAQCIHLLEHLYLSLVDSIAARRELNIMNAYLERKGWLAAKIEARDAE
ncbi:MULTISPECIES: hypothetical protein [Pseudomonadaceae]|uniref:Uncharacterized protein n=1 Tax=Metapseudomonas resinovorans NBRC 106553 TaxID=1245471 RepID=S6ARA3_METRE|nr:MULTISPECIES: hypothetical protein [Pseudomonas]MDH4560208.1 hypothetical protein [Pseudomonas sp. BN411]BAN46486.1 hypothetical protein PCA10_07540 [Pseudomonas resinovorans NBRC 106553]